MREGERERLVKTKKCENSSGPVQDSIVVVAVSGEIPAYLTTQTMSKETLFIVFFSLFFVIEVVQLQPLLAN